MTKEELRKEAEEWLSITDNHLNDERTHFLSESEYAEQAYLAGAEPREKRIEELEKENETLSQNLDDAMSVENCLKKRITDLEEENAELKETVIKMNNVITETFSNLTKAKELLERLLITSCNSDVLNLLPNCSEVLRVRVEAEQFLYSEVEK